MMKRCFATLLIVAKFSESETESRGGFIKRPLIDDYSIYWGIGEK